MKVIALMGVATLIAGIAIAKVYDSHKNDVMIICVHKENPKATDWYKIGNVSYVGFDLSQSNEPICN